MRPPFTMADLEEIYPYASGYSKEHEEYKEEAQEATAQLQAGNRGYLAIWQHIINVSVADLKRGYNKLDASPIIFVFRAQRNTCSKYSA